MGDILSGLVGWWKMDDASSVPVTVNPPTNVVASVIENGSGNYSNFGYCFEYIVVAYKVVGGNTYYSPAVSSGLFCDSGSGDTFEHVDISWTAAAGVDGYKVLIKNDAFGANYDYTYTLAGTSFTDGDGTEGGFVLDNEISNTQTFADSSGSANTGTGYGNITVGATGLFGRATTFYPSVSTYVFTPNTITNGDQSQALWVNMNDVSNGYVMDEGANNHWIQIYSGKVRCGLQGGTGEYLDSVFNMATSAWIHIVTTYNRTTGAFKLYVNGALDSSATYGPNTPSTLTIADSGSFGFTGEEFNGTMQDVRLFNRVLSQTDIDLLYAYRGVTARRRASVVHAI